MAETQRSPSLSYMRNFSIVRQWFSAMTQLRSPLLQSHLTLPGIVQNRVDRTIRSLNKIATTTLATTKTTTIAPQSSTCDVAKRVVIKDTTPNIVLDTASFEALLLSHGRLLNRTRCHTRYRTRTGVLLPHNSHGIQ